MNANEVSPDSEVNEFLIKQETSLGEYINEENPKNTLETDNPMQD